MQRHVLPECRKGGGGGRCDGTHLGDHLNGLFTPLFHEHQQRQCCPAAEVLPDECEKNKSIIPLLFIRLLRHGHSGVMSSRQGGNVHTNLLGFTNGILWLS